MYKTPEQTEVLNIEYRLHSIHGYDLKVKSVPDPENRGHVIWTVEAKHPAQGHSFNSKPVYSRFIPLNDCYREALKDIEKQVSAYYTARGLTY